MPRNVSSYSFGSSDAANWTIPVEVGGLRFARYATAPVSFPTLMLQLRCEKQPIVALLDVKHVLIKFAGRIARAFDTAVQIQNVNLGKRLHQRPMP